MMNYNLSYYEEIADEKVVHTRMKYTGDTVRLNIAGVSYDSYPLDSLNTEFLVTIKHHNGTASWYYPVKKLLPFDPSKPGTTIGVASKAFFWQLRYMNRSFNPRTFFDDMGMPTNKGIFMETSYRYMIGPKMRYLSFLKNYRLELNMDIKNNFNLDLENEMNSIKN